MTTKIAVSTETMTTVVLDVGEYTFRLSPDEAIEMACKLVFMADGCLVSDTDNGEPVRWNTKSRFHQEYARRMKTSFV